MIHFVPDLIVEVTEACNRSCSGCYAANTVTGKSPLQLLEERPDLFLSVKKFSDFIESWPYGILSTVALRGGEPSLHPELTLLISEAIKISKKVFIETHGRWLLEKNRADYSNLIAAVQKIPVTVKVSYDSMHGLKFDELLSIASFLSSIKVDYAVAITEKTQEEYEITRRTIKFVPDSKIIFQPKASSVDQLIRPVFGILNTEAILVSGLNSRFDGNSIGVDPDFSLFEVAQ